MPKAERTTQSTLTSSVSNMSVAPPAAQRLAELHKTVTRCKH